VELNPNNEESRLQLAHVYYRHWMTSSPSRGSDLKLARLADEQLQEILRRNPHSDSAQRVKIQLYISIATASPQPPDSEHYFDEAEKVAKEYQLAHAGRKESFLQMASLQLARCQPLQKQVASPSREAPPPARIEDPKLRQHLREIYLPRLDAAIQNLERAISFEPNDLMALSLMRSAYTQRSLLAESDDQHRADQLKAEDYMRLITSVNAARGVPSDARIRVGGAVQAANLVHKVDPVYPDQAKEARVQGVVRFRIVIGKDGSVERMQLVSGHPLLVLPAQSAVKQWRYRPTLLNGSPVTVETEADVDFKLGPPSAI
jgi:TonB family protein